ncbi:IS66 family insertion sequence element accessory protein TnpB, partial [Escherichia coli]
HVFIFRGRNGSQVKLLWSTGDGLCLLTKRLERGRFAWPSARDIQASRASRACSGVIFIVQPPRPLRLTIFIINFGIILKLPARCLL